MRFRFSPLSLLLAVTVLLRLALCLKGGQRFFVDEFRFERALAVLSDARIHGIARGLTTLFSGADHLGFTLACLPLAFLQVVLRSGFGIPIASTYWVSSFALSLSCAGTVFLTHRIARLLGAGTREALGSAFLVTCSGVLVYFSRHLVPYDLALFCLLGFAAAGLANENQMAPGARAGVWALLAFQIYNGYWISLASLGLALVARDLYGGHLPWKKYLAIALVFSGGILALEAISRGFVSESYFTRLVQFSTTAVQGDTSEGWSFPGEYLWQAEGWPAVFWILSALALPLSFFGRRSMATARPFFIWFLLFVSYGAFVFFSNGLGRFVIYGRSVRPLIPFFAMGGAFWLNRFADVARARKAFYLGMGFFLALAFPPFGKAFTLSFPADFERQARALGFPFHSCTTLLRAKSDSSNRPCSAEPGYWLVNVQRHFYPPQTRSPLPAGRTLLATPHPLAFLPYQYEGYSAPQRTLLRSADLTMRLLRIDDISQ